MMRRLFFTMFFAFAILLVLLVAGGAAYAADTWDVEMGWTANTETDLSGYRLYMSQDDGVTWAQIAEVAASETAYTHRVTVAGNYTFTISAFDSSDNESGKYSPAPSVTLDGTPPNIPMGFLINRVVIVQ